MTSRAASLNVALQSDNTAAQVREVLQRLQDGYVARDPSRLDEFMRLFVQDGDPELIGTGASERGGNEWFEGPEAIREIIESDWIYWGDVSIDVERARISVLGDVAWLSTTGKVMQTGTFDEALPFYLQQMKDLLENEELDADGRLVEATHFGMRRVRERHKGLDHAWPFVLTAVLVQAEDQWRFHTIHWSMPVD
jgi:hypothetical protein